MSPTRPRASTNEVHAELRSDILAGVHEPGARLKFSDLCERYSASVTVVREAMARLTEQGLLESEPRIGFRVRRVSAEDLNNLTEARIQLESLALRRAMTAGGVDWESRLVASHHRLERTPMFADTDPPRVSEQWEKAHQDFHSELLSGCPNPWLTTMAGTLRDAAELYRRWSQRFAPTRDVAAEHREILAAVLAGDPDEAVARLCSHYQGTAGIVSRGMGEKPHPEPA